MEGKVMKQKEFIAIKLSEAFEIPITVVEEAILKHNDQVSEFIESKKNALVWYHQKRSSNDRQASIFISDIDICPVNGKAIAFLSSNLPPNSSSSSSNDSHDDHLSCIELLPGMTGKSLQTLISDVFLPLISMQPPFPSKNDALQQAGNILANFPLEKDGHSTEPCLPFRPHEGSTSLLRQPSPELAEIINNMDVLEQQESTVANAIVGLLEEWTHAVHAAITPMDPDIEHQDHLAHISLLSQKWNERAALLSGLDAQLKDQETSRVYLVASAVAPTVLKRLRFKSEQLAEVLYQAKEISDSLNALVPSLEPLEKIHNAAASQNCGHGLLSNPSTEAPLHSVQYASILKQAFVELRLAAASVRSLSDPAVLCDVLQCISRQLASQAHALLLSNGGEINLTNAATVTAAGGGGAVTIWNQSKHQMISYFDCIAAIYKELQAHAQDLFASLPSDQMHSMAKNTKSITKKITSVHTCDAALAPYTQFIQKCDKIKRVLLIASRFELLSQHAYIPILKTSIEEFAQLFEVLKKEHPSPLQDATVLSTAVSNCLHFDKDIFDFETHVNDIESRIENSLKNAFHRATSTEHALRLIHQYTPFLLCDVIDVHVDNMYAEAFQKFGNDIESIQSLYEKHKSAPPACRGVPPVTGAILWSRGLLQKIKQPMEQFAARETLMASKESKKIIKSYNRLAQTLLEFEALWNAAYLRSTEALQTQLQAPIFVFNPKNNKLHVNLDAAVLMVLRETRWMGTLGFAIPDSVRKALLLSDRLTLHLGQLSSLVKKINEAVLFIPRALHEMLLQPHVSSLLKHAEPGMSSMSWISASLDSYIQQLTAVVDCSLNLMHRCTDMHRNRIEAVLDMVACKDMTKILAQSQQQQPNHHHCRTCAEFSLWHSEQMAKYNAFILQKIDDIEAASEDIIQQAMQSLHPSKIVTASSQQRVHALHVDPRASEAYKSSCCALMNSAVLNSISLSLKMLAKEFGGKFSKGDSVPLATATEFSHLGNSRDSSSFLLSLELHLDASREIAVYPSLEDSRKCIAACAQSIYDSKEMLKGVTDAGNDGTSLDIKETLDTLALSFQSMQSVLQTHLASFDQYAFLWKTDCAQAYEYFLQENPSLEDCENQLRRFNMLEQDLQALIPPSLAISCAIVLTTDPLKHAVHALLMQWKTQFSQKLHEKASNELQSFNKSLNDLISRLQHKIEDLHDLEIVVRALNESRRADIEFEKIYVSIEELYNLLARYAIDVPKQEMDMMGDAQYAMRALQRGTLDATASVERVQDGLLLEVKDLSGVLSKESTIFKTRWDADGPAAAGLSPAQATARLRSFKSEFEPYKRKLDKLTAGESLFRLPKTPLPILHQIEEEIAVLDELYGLYSTVLLAIQERGKLSWADAIKQFDGMATQVSEFQNTSRKMPKSYREWQAYKDCRKTIEDLSATMPLLQGLSHKSMKDRHWHEVARITGATVLPIPSEGLLLQHLLESNLLAHRDEIEDLCSSVSKEEAVEKKLKSVADQWAVESFTFADHKQRGPVILKPADTAELLERLEDSTMVLGSLSASRYSTPFRAEIQSLAAKLSSVDESLDRWLSVQAMWSYMEAVFSGGDIVKQLPAEAKRFQSIDKSFIKMVAHAKETGRVLDTCTGSDQLRALLPHLLEQLELCQKSLAAYLETKRAEFPRFYFVSDPTLLEILSLGSDPSAVIPHFQSGLFDSLSNITFDATDKHAITEMWSREGEKVPLGKPVDSRGTVEIWLQGLVTGMQDTIRGQIRKAVSEVNTMPLAEFIFSRPAQVALLGLQLKWTSDTLAGLQGAAREEKGALTKALNRAEGTLHELVALALNTNLTRVQRTTLETCITVYLHQKEATEELVRKRIRDPRDFEWLKQCRVTWRDDKDTVIISICDVSLEYSYEYLGVKERLVITPLTDVCYITLTQALGMFLGGAPAGPAGTGKTETTKDLGATLGKYVVVFNCSDQMDHKGLGKIFKGLAQSGLWGCFDEFNRINVDVLSVCAQQVSSVFAALRERRKTFTFTDGTVLPIDPRVGIFITMNPGYAGRQELPENLKALFRSVTMMVPDRQIIMKVKLAAAGYHENDVLAKKFNVLYSLCEQQLSKQPHYDFGLRNILSVLRTAGASKRKNGDAISETELIMRTLRDMNMSKFVAEDVPLFLALLDDLFPGHRTEHAPAADVAAALERVCKERGLQAHPSWIEKCLQLYDTSLVRHGIMIIGPPGSGKSTAIDCLAAALTDLGQKTVVWRMNPKAITASQMFGKMDAATGDWTDGIFATLWRRAAKAPIGQMTWIVLDGPVDAVWIENLNTVLDDNKVLTLANGDRVLMTPAMRLFFEPENLNNASPATVSRAGIIHFSESELGWKPVVESWLQGRPVREAAVLRSCCDRMIASTLDFVKTECKAVMKCETVCLVNSLLTLLNGALGHSTKFGAATSNKHGDRTAQQEDSGNSLHSTSPISDVAGSSDKDGAGLSLLKESDATAIKLEKIFLFCLAWSCGSLLEVHDRSALHQHLASTSMCMPVGRTSEQSDTIFEYFVDDLSGEWQHWSSKVPEWEYPQNASFSQMIVPTMESIRCEHLLWLVHKAGKSSLLVGGPGTMKTTIIKQFLSQKFDSDAYTSKTITFSTLTTPAICQASLEGCFEKRQGRSFGPIGGKKSNIFLDDLSMPATNTWGDQVTNEFTRQVLEQGGYYSTEKPIGEFKQLVDVSYIAAMSLPGAGRSDIPNRLKRQFCMLYVPPPSTRSITGIFGKLMAGHFSPQRCQASTCSLAQNLVSATIDLWSAVQSKLLPTPAKFHYIFTMRDISRIFQGLMKVHMPWMPYASPLGNSSSSNNSSKETNITSKRNASGGALEDNADLLLITAWIHECKRVFCDKLISPDDKTWLEFTIGDICQQHHLASVMNTSSDALLSISQQKKGMTYFADFLRDAPLDEATGEPAGPRPSCYELASGGLVELKTRIENLMSVAAQSCRPGEGPPELVLFDDALEHALRISRVLSMERGSALLVGVGGSGKQSLARLAAFLAGAICFKITLTKSYGITNFLEDLKTLYKQVAFKPFPIVFLITESDIKDESFLEYINQILMTGEVAGLFTREELDGILNDMRPAMRAEQPGVPDTSDNLQSFFIRRVRARLHIVLCISPVGPRFARWAQQFPGIINGCTIDWFLPWPQEALLSVSSKLLSASSASHLFNAPPSHLLAVQSLMASVHTRISTACQQYYLQHRRQVHVTPKSYIAAIESFKGLYARKLTQLRGLASSLATGLQKMNSAKEDVSNMRVELVAKNQNLELASIEAEKLLKEISDSTMAAEKERSKVAFIVEGVRKKAEEIAAVKAEAEADLQAAQPVLEAALTALNSISPKDIVALKALKSPPDVIKRIFDCVLLLRHYPVNKPTWQDVKGASVLVASYDEAVKMMSDMNFLQALLTFPKESINDETVELLKPYFAAPDFNYESAKKASGSVAGLCNWAESMCKYHQVAKAVEPKIIKLRAAEGELRLAEAEKQGAERELAAVQARLSEMQAKLDAAIAHKGALAADAAATQTKMDNAIALMAALAGEEARWHEQNDGLEGAIRCLVGDCAVASTFVSYLGPFNRQFREQLLADIISSCAEAGLPLSSSTNVSSFLADDAEIGQWAVEGLPGDGLSIQNGILVTRATRCPFLIDPQGQGRSWLIKKESTAGLKITQLSDKQYRSVVEECISQGIPLLIENVEEDVDPMLEPLLERKFVVKGRSTVVMLGDKEVDIGSGFKMYITSRLSQPKLTPETFARVAVIDFTVTPSGLEDQLLDVLVLKEKKELEEQRRRLLEEVQSCRQRIAKLEEDLLFRLSSSTGNLIDDTALVDVLALTKSTATEVKERMNIATETRQRITVACEEYRPAAHRAMLLYFLIAEFAAVNPMYQTSLAQFTRLYHASIDLAAKSSVPLHRVSNITEHLTAAVYDYVQRGLFQRHKLVFAFLMANKIDVSAGKILPAEMDTLLKLGTGAETSNARKKPKEWIPLPVWKNILLLADKIPDAFAHLPESVAEHDTAWKAWYDSDAPDNAEQCPPLCPNGNNGSDTFQQEDSSQPSQMQHEAASISPFQKVCLIRAFREDRVMLAVTGYVAHSLGQRFVQRTPVSPEQALEQSMPTCPIICILSAGSDPTKSIEELAKRRKIKCCGVSLGQGQEIYARKLLSTAATEGSWVLLQNAHLGLSYMSEIEQFLAKSGASSLHSSFRLWITSEPHPLFPIGLLHASLKLTNEAPVGIRAGLQASYQSITQDVLDAVPRQEWRQLLFMLCFLHAVVQERRKFGPIGWNVPYEFNSSDLSACVQFLQNHMIDIASRRASSPDWSTLQYMISAIQYGGRITDERDKAIMDAYAEKFMREEALVSGYRIFGNLYWIPEGTEIDAYRKGIEEFPLQDSPELFGLHGNADLTCKAFQVAEAMAIVSELQPKGSGSASSSATAVTSLSKEESVQKTCDALLNKLPKVVGHHDTAHALHALPGGPTLPLNIHLRQEIERLDKVISMVSDSLSTLKLAVAGTIALSDDLLGTMDALYAGKVPAAWLKKSWESPSLNAWFQGLLQRFDQLHRWLTSGKPKSFWFPGFFNPQGFLTAVKQEVTRQHARSSSGGSSETSWALDDVVLVSEVTKFVDYGAVKDHPMEGVYIHGLSLDGCSWNVKQGKLADPEPKKVFGALPVLYVTAVQIKDKKSAGYFEIPCYRNKKRTGMNFVTNFMVKTDERKEKWVLRGAAMLCSTE